MFETFLKLSGFGISDASERLRQIQLLSTDEFRKWQNDQKWAIARYHYDNNPFYREKVGKHFPDVWEDLPIMGNSNYLRNNTQWKPMYNINKGINKTIEYIQKHIEDYKTERYIV